MHYFLDSELLLPATFLNCVSMLAELFSESVYQMRTQEQVRS